jgi:hypothetical protein
MDAIGAQHRHHGAPAVLAFVELHRESTGDGGSGRLDVVGEVGNQVLVSSHRELLSSKARVVNVAEKSEQDFGRLDWERRAQANRR